MLAPAVSATILVVDDLDMIRHMLTRMLTLAGYTVVEAADEQALTLLRTHDQPVDLVLTDVLMPGMNGTELAVPGAARVRGDPGDARVGLSAGRRGDGRRFGRSVPLVQKPIDWQELARTVGAVLAEDKRR